MRKLILVISMLAVAGCTGSSKPGCVVENGVTAVVSAAISSQLVCKNLDAVKADVQKEVAKLNMCASSTQSIVGDLVCPSLVNSLVSGLLSKIPAAWECTGGTAPDQIKQILIDTCKKSI